MHERHAGVIAGLAALFLSRTPPLSILPSIWLIRLWAIEFWVMAARDLAGGSQVYPQGFWKNPTIKPGTTGKLQDPSLMGDGSKDGATGSQDAKTDPMATLAADVAAIKKDVADRLPKKTTGKT